MLKEVQHEQYAGHPAGPGGPYPPGNTRYAEKRTALRRGDRRGLPRDRCGGVKAPGSAPGGGPCPGPAGGQVHLLRAEHLGAGGGNALARGAEGGGYGVCGGKIG